MWQNNAISYFVSHIYSKQSDFSRTNEHGVTQQTLFWLFMFYGGAFNRNLYFRVQTGTTTNLFNRGVSCLCLWGGAFSRNLYFHVQTGTISNLFLFVYVHRVVLLVAYCTSMNKQAPQQSDNFSCLCL